MLSQQHYQKTMNITPFMMQRDLIVLDENTTDIKIITKMIAKLFDHWELSNKEQLYLLGMNAENRSSLTRFRNSTISTMSFDLRNRISYLLLIHEKLRTLYPEDNELCYSWVKERNPIIQNYSPLEIMLKGIVGLNYVSDFLDEIITR